MNEKLLILLTLPTRRQESAGLVTFAVMLMHGFKPGSFVPKDGLYWVHHYQHRISHQSYLKNGESFPQCRKCGERVRFDVAREHPSAEHISRDLDFPGDQPDASQNDDLS